MTGTFAGWAAEHYATFRRDVPERAVTELAVHFGLDRESLVVDVGAGTGQATVPLARHGAAVLAIEPEPDLLRRLRTRTDLPANVVTVLGSDQDLALIGRLLGGRGTDLVTVVNALQFMETAEMFARARAVLRPGGGIAIASHGIPMWLAQTDWARALNAYLTDWLDAPVRDWCGLDENTRAERARLLASAGFVDVTVLRYAYDVELTADFVIGHLYSALSSEQVPPERRQDFEAGLRSVIERSATGPLVEHVPVVTLAARTPS